MTIEFENLNLTTDKNKAVPNLEHEFRPLESDPDLVFTCTYFKSGELMSGYVDMKTNGDMKYRFRDIFADKVKAIRGLTIKDKKTNKTIEVTDAKTFLSLPGKGTFDQLVTIVAAHLISGDGLNEEEVKNFN